MFYSTKIWINEGYLAWHSTPFYFSWIFELSTDATDIVIKGLYLYQATLSEKIEVFSVEWLWWNTVCRLLADSVGLPGGAADAAAYDRAAGFWGVSVVEPYDDDGHVITTVFPVVSHRLGAAHVQDLFTEVRQNQLVSAACTRGDWLAPAAAATAAAVRLSGASQPTLDKVGHLGVGHGVPDPIGAYDHKLPIRVQLEGLDLGYHADDLFPGWFVLFRLEEEVPETPGGD